MTFPLRIQVAGVLDVEEAQLLARLAVTAVGMPMVLDTHPEELTPAMAQEITTFLHDLPQPRPVPVLITYLSRPEDILDLCRDIGVNLVQLHGRSTPEQAARLRRIAPDIGLVRSLVLRPGTTLETLLEEGRGFAPHVQAFLTDSFDPTTGASGATGRTHDWQLSRRLARELPRPLILAGGLTPDNVTQAIETVGPAGVDAHTGLEGPDGHKAPELVRAFVQRACLALESLALESLAFDARKSGRGTCQTTGL